MSKKKIILIVIVAVLIILLGFVLYFKLKPNDNEDITKFEHIISITSNKKKIEAVTGSFCYREGACIDKIDFQDFQYDEISSFYDNKLYINNLDGTIKSIELFDYSLKNFIDTKVEFTNEYIITPSINGSYIVKINAIYQGKSIEYYFMININKTSDEDINSNKEDIGNIKGTISFNGLTFSILEGYDVDLDEDDLHISDDKKTWDAYISVSVADYDDVVAGKDTIISNVEKSGEYKVNNCKEKNYNGTPYLVMENYGLGVNYGHYLLVGFVKSNSKGSYVLEVYNKSNKYDYKAFEDVVKILQTGE